MKFLVNKKHLNP